jgi:hypothetical protein
LYSEELISGSSFIVDGDNYTVRGGSTVGVEGNFTKIILRRQGSLNSSYLISIGKCETTQKYIYCFDSLRLSDNPDSIDNNGVFQPYLKITVKSNTASISVERTTAITLNYNEKKQFSITMKNSDVKSAIATYTEKFPSAIQISEASNCNINNNILTFTYNMAGNSDKTCTFTMQSNSYENSTTTANYVYNVDGQQFDIFLEPTIVTVNLPYEISESLDTTTVDDLDKVITYTYKIKNKESAQSMDYSLVINPRGAHIITAPGFQNVNGIYKMSSSIDPGKDSTMEITFKPAHTGSNSITGTATIESGGKSFFFNTNASYTVNILPVKVAIGIQPEILVPGQNVKLNLTLANDVTNKNTFSAIQGILSGIIIQSIDYPSLAPGDSVVVYDQNIQVSNLNTSTVLFSFNGSYKTETGERVPLYVEKRVSINNEVKISNATKPSNPVVQNITQPPNSPNPLVVNNSPPTKPDDSKPTQNNSDFLTKIFTSINSFIKDLFGI